MLENVALDPVTRALDLNDERLTENTRAAYPISFIENAEPSGRGGHPKNVIMLTADAFGVLPPISRLTPEGAIYHFLSGYTARVAGTEKGVTEPAATFSTCFGAPFLPLAPQRYARMLGDRIARHRARVWLVNTGWTGGGYGVGQRMKIAYTRAMIRAALSGALDTAVYERDQRFNLEVPTSCPDVPAGVLKPRSTWSRVNIAHAQRLTQAGRMAQPGLAAFHVREGEPTGVSSPERNAMKLAPAYARRFRADAVAWAYFEAEAPWYRRTSILWIMSAKQEQTRVKRLETLIACSRRRVRVPPLRRP